MLISVRTGCAAWTPQHRSSRVVRGHCKSLYAVRDDDKVTVSLWVTQNIEQFWLIIREIDEHKAKAIWKQLQMHVFNTSHVVISLKFYQWGSFLREYFGLFILFWNFFSELWIKKTWDHYFFFIVFVPCYFYLIMQLKPYIQSNTGLSILFKLLDIFL